jgi:hypothetical protein
MTVVTMLTSHVLIKPSPASPLVNFLSPVVSIFCDSRFDHALVMSFRLVCAWYSPSRSPVEVGLSVYRLRLSVLQLRVLIRVSTETKALRFVKG